MAKKDPRYLSEIRTRISEGSETNNSLQTKLGEDWRITDIEGLTTQPRPNPKSLDLPLRYEPSVVLGIGGMGEVYRVFDRELQRYIAMKVIRSDLASRKLVRERFVEEAQICAQMQHPNIIPVYELGILPDGRDFFTMKEVDGTELSTLIGKVHAAASSGTWEPISNGWTFRRLIDNFVSVCEAVAHAHSQGVIHRDLKPANIMIGTHGEVWVMDWGIAKVHGRNDSAYMAVVVRSSRSKTRMGMVAGTPHYMSPEQAAGKTSQVGMSSDIYSLGAILYEILAGRPPFLGDAELVLEMLREKLPVQEPTAKAPLPKELIGICMNALRSDIDSRTQSARELADQLHSWLDGAKRREKALILVEDAEKLRPKVVSLRQEANKLQQKVQAMRKQTPMWVGVEEKQQLWELEDKNQQLQLEAQVVELDLLERLRSALTYVRNLPEAHKALADYYYERHAEAEMERVENDVIRYGILLRRHNRGLYDSYLKGDGVLSLKTSVTASVRLFRYVESQRRLIPTLLKDLGQTPLHEVSLPMGSYLIELTADQCELVCLPVHIPRAGAHKDVPPDQDTMMAINLPKRGSIAANECYVPAGWALLGSPQFPKNPRRRCWLDGFVMQKFPVTNRDYLAFLNSLAAQGKTEEAIRWAPKLRGSMQMVYGFRNESGKAEFFMQPDPEGHLWDLDWPVILVSCEESQAYADWYATNSGLPWRLPTTEEWEKAARGVDGRHYPWGNYCDPTWTRTRESSSTKPMPVVVDSYPIDISPYGIRGLGGNSQDWCLIPGVQEDASYRGGAWSHHSSFVPCASYREVSKLTRTETAGIRLVRSL